MRPIFFGCLTALLLSLSFGGQSPATHAVTPAPTSKIEIRPLPQQLMQRYEPLHAALQTSARAWVDQQAKIEAKRPKPDLNALRAAIRQRFPGSFSAPASLRQGGDIDAVVYVVLMQTSQNVEAKIDADAAQIQDMELNIKTLLNEIEQLNQNMASLPKSAQSNSPCITPLCRSLPSTLARINSSTARFPHPIHLQAPASLTLAQLQTLVNQMESSLSTVGDDSQLANMDLHNLQQQQQQTLQMLSDIDKSVNDTAMSIIGNLK
jgi:DNA anti-recombination protein RmuC